ncbi:hypothetical protein DFH94DRAFT_480227 [Russula ochroleuca]|jgi:hypothetical protein|uniref:Uncharacterized protein n=1 Tax=Russula ochroleuca TaxID=152965 RepID=A0A9P5T991_9AGAM|nr:hypothetical protein DFH94DRAFT_480227 [Russula ochroleuca]
MEAKFYYAGLPSTPVLVARTGTAWKAPTGPEAYQRIRELRAVGNHALKEVWEGNLALKLHTLLDTMQVKWTSTDVLRIGNKGESSAPVILWIGVMPASLSGDYGVVVASRCQELLVKYNIADVDVEIRESVVTRSAGPRLLVSRDSDDPTVGVHEPLTSTLGLPICAQSTPSVEGTGGFFIAEGGNAERLLLVTARHVIFTPDKDNKHFEHKNDSQSRYNVTLFGDVAFKKYLEFIKAEIEGKAINAEHQVGRMRVAEGNDDPRAKEVWQDAQHRLEKEREVMEELIPFYEDVSTRWATQESRLLGHVVLSPPINFGSNSGGYTEDWAVIKIDASKVDASNFNGNAIDLGSPSESRYSRLFEITRKLNLNPRNAHSFTFPVDRLLKFEGIIPDEEMRHPTALDQNDDPCLIVIKRGNTTGLTFGRANDVYSYARNYYDDGKAETSKEWAILPFDSKSGAFSAVGDSGSVIVDGRGRIGGLLTSGAGATHSLDVTYATPISFLLERMQDNGLQQLNLNPVLTG